MRAVFFLAFFCVASVFAGQAGANEHKLLRRLTVFPFQVDKAHSKVADDAWWKLRETLTDNKRFLVAAKNFLVKKDVFQPRGQLSPADAIILGQLLDAQGLVVTYIQDRDMTMSVYDGQVGQLLWTQTLQLHPGIPISQQLMSASQKLIGDFIASIPYQGFVIVDSLYGGKPIFKRDQKIMFKADVGVGAVAQIGDKVQLIRVTHDKMKPLFTEGAQIEIFGEGKIDSVERDGISVQLQRVTKLDDVKEETLVRLPQEFNRMRDRFSIQSQLKAKQLPDAQTSGMISLEDQAIEEKRPLMASITFLANIALFLLLAF